MTKVNSAFKLSMLFLLVALVPQSELAFAKGSTNNTPVAQSGCLTINNQAAYPVNVSVAEQSYTVPANMSQSTWCSPALPYSAIAKQGFSQPVVISSMGKKLCSYTYTGMSPSASASAGSAALTGPSSQNTPPYFSCHTSTSNLNGAVQLNFDMGSSMKHSAVISVNNQSNLALTFKISGLTFQNLGGMTPPSLPSGGASTVEIGANTSTQVFEQPLPYLGPGHPGSTATRLIGTISLVDTNGQSVCTANYLATLPTWDDWGYGNTQYTPIIFTSLINGKNYQCNVTIAQINGGCAENQVCPSGGDGSENRLESYITVTQL